ncbi:MAG TPA: hypothetical protein PLF63_06235 [Rubrivivax sp.]|nr:hypothetical protein [Rubrivivax sp.]
MVSFSAMPELWEISLNPHAEPIYHGLVHDFRMGEGVPEPGYLGARRSRIEPPIAQFTLDASGSYVLARAVDSAAGAAPRVRLLLIHLDVRRVIGRFESRPIEALHVSQPLLARLVGPRELDILRKDRLGALVQAQVDARHAERLDEWAVLALALLPAGRHQREATVETVAPQQVAELLTFPMAAVPRSLRTEQGHRLRVPCPRFVQNHRAYTFSVWPTMSSMRRSSS